MSDKSESHDVGYGKPPKKTRWKKGQCGNPKRIRKRRHKTLVQMVDQLFSTSFGIPEGDGVRPGTIFEGIVLQLWRKEMSGNKRATNVLLKYQEFAAQRGGTGGVEIVWGPQRWGKKDPER